MSPESLMQILDGGRGFNGGNPPEEIRFNDAHVPNPQRNAPPQTILGAKQKAWFKDKLKSSTATWKIWANSQGALDERADPQNLPPGLTKESWPKDGGYANVGSADYGNAYAERAEIYDLVRDAKITGFAIVSGDRHSFWAGYATAELPPGKFEPVGLSFVGASLTSPGTMEAYEHNLQEGRSAPIALSRGQAGTGKAGLDLQHAAEARRPFVPGICKELRPEARPVALQPGSGSAPRVRRSWRTRICEGPIVGRCDAHRVCLHPAPHYAERKTGRRANQVSSLTHRCIVEERRKASPRSTGPGRKCRPEHLEIRPRGRSFYAGSLRQDLFVR